MQEGYWQRRAYEVAEQDVLVMDEAAYVADAARAMRQKGVSSVIVGSEPGLKPVGIVTERDILYRVVAEHQSPYKTTLKEVMSSPLITIDASAEVKEAVEIMRKKGIRRMPVVSEGKIAGMLTLKSIVGDSRKRDIELAEVELPAKLSVLACPYCGSKFEAKEDLSKHIDRLHLGAELLEGDVRGWEL